MPSVRFSRDKRGYEYVYLVHTPTKRGKPGRSQVLYWYRTPPGVRIGRKPFPDDVQRMLEAQNPGVAFDWPAIINTPMPPPDMTEFWREKRRAAKAAREERRLQERDEEAEVSQGQASDADVPADLESDLQEPPPELLEAGAAGSDGGDDSEESNGDEAESPADATAARKRRRRRGGRRRRGAAAPQAGSGEAGADAASAATPFVSADIASEPSASPTSRDDQTEPSS